MSKPTLTYDMSMPLSEFVERHYIPMAGRNRPSCRPLSSHRQAQVRRVVALLKAMLWRDPLLSDLTPENAAKLMAWYQKSFGWGGARHAEVCETVMRFAGIVKDRRADVRAGINRGLKDTRALSDEPGTLWHYCVNEYFPKNTRIRSPKTRHQYRMALCDFKEVLGHEPTTADLEDDNIAMLINRLLDKKVARKTTNERRCRIHALWNWMAKRRLVAMFPTTPRIPVPRRIPKAYTLEELARLFASCREEVGLIAEGIQAADFWTALHGVLWDTAGRIGEILALRWEWLDESTGLLAIEAEVRKGQDQDMLHPLGKDTLAVLARMKPAGYERIFHWPYDEGSLYKIYNRILKRAQLSTDRKSKFHKMRKSVASHLQQAGIDACTALGHSSPEVTRQHYLDPRIVVTRKPIDVLPRFAGAGPAAIEAEPEPLLLTYREVEPPVADPFAFV